MRSIRSVQIVAFSLFIAGAMCASWGCGGDANNATGKQVVEDPKVIQNREQMIQDMYKAKKK